MSYVQGIHQYGLAAASSDIPPSWGSSSLPRPISSSNQLLNIASQSGSQSASGLISFQIPTGASAGGYLKGNSVYLRGRCTVTGAGGAVVKYNNPTNSASSMIYRLTISIGGVVISQINNYHILHDMLLCHSASQNYYANDSALLESTNSNAFAAAANPTNDFVIPLICPLFTSDKAVPLFLLNAPIQVNLDLNTVANTLFGAANDAANFTISNPQLIYEVCHVDSDYVNQVKTVLASGNAYQLNLHDFHCISTAALAGLNYQVGCNFSSLRGVLYTTTTNAPAVNAQTYFLDNTQTILDYI
jgi:hypothetical protein